MQQRATLVSNNKCSMVREEKQKNVLGRLLSGVDDDQNDRPTSACLEARPDFLVSYSVL